MGLITALRANNLTEIIDIIQILVIAEILAIFVLIAFILISKMALIKKNKQSIIRKKQFSQQLHNLNSNNLHLTPQMIRLYKKYIFDFIECLSNDQTESVLSDKLRNEIARTILVPKAKQLSQSAHWIKQNFAVACYQYAKMDSQDEDILIKLMHSEILTIGLSVARLIVQNPSQRTMHALISILSNSRKLHQDIYLQILPNVNGIDKALLTQYFIHPLEKNTDVYVRCLCYRMAKSLIPIENLFAIIQADLLNPNIELKISALNYLSCIPSDKSIALIERSTQADAYEIRAVAIKLLGDCHVLTSIPILEKCLRDSAWWVRINAANALAKLGKEGIHSLQEQTADVDKFAYEAAQKILLTLGVPNEFGQNN